jgi:hypothetical protein
MEAQYLLYSNGELPEIFEFKKNASIKLYAGEKR